MKPLTEETYPEAPRPLTVDANWVSRKDVLTKFNKLGLEIRLNKFGDDTKVNKLGVDTNPSKLGVEINPLTDDI
jgi:hypothetical protein